MFQLTKEFRRVSQRAHAEAKRMQCEFPGTEHFLLALAAETQGLAFQALNSMGLDYARVRQALMDRYLKEPDRLRPPLTEHMEESEKRVHATFEAARGLGDSFIDADHLLLALLSLPECMACAVLDELQIVPADLQGKVLDLAAKAPPHPFSFLESYRQHPQIKSLLKNIELNQTAKEEATARADYERVMALVIEQDELCALLQDTLQRLAADKLVQ